MAIEMASWKAAKTSNTATIYDSTEPRSSLTKTVKKHRYFCAVNSQNEMKTFILEWRPSISSYKMEDFENDMNYLEYGEFNWSVWDWQHARSGDNFYLVKCGEGKTGIVMKGFFTSKPYEADDWSGRNRNVHYMDLRPTFMVHPRTLHGILSCEELNEAMPEFQWDGGHSGRLLPNDYVPILNRMWDDYVSSLESADKGEGLLYSKNCRPMAGIDDAISLATRAHRDATDLDGLPVILHPLHVGLAGSNDSEMICGFLHDVMEDTDWSAGAIREEGFSEEVIDTLMLLTHDKTVPYLDYIRAIANSGNRTALAVKLNDLRHNLERGRAGGHDKQVAKHSAALELIESLLEQDSACEH